MSEKTFIDYIENKCNPIGYDEQIQSYTFGQSTVDMLLDKVNDLQSQLVEKEKEQNQKAIEQLQELLEKTQTLNIMVKSYHYINQKQVNVVFEDIIMQKISELKGDNDERK